MGYRDDLIQRLQRDGVWEHLTVEQQARFQNLTDDQARQMMVADDHWEMGDERAIEVFGMMSLIEMGTLFRGTLVQRGPKEVGKLSKAGRLLAEFLVELREKGISSDEIYAGLQRLSPLVITALTTVYRQEAE